MSTKLVYSQAAAHVAAGWRPAELVQALALLQSLPDAGEIFAAIERADEILEHVHHVCRALAGELPREAALMALAMPEPELLPPALVRRLSWRPPGYESPF